MAGKVIGIIGGMGPLATVDLFNKITLNTEAATDQEHPRVCIDSNTDIADRTAALLYGGEDPTEELVKSARRLESIGADMLVMPCNTAHGFYDAIAASVGIPVLHMIRITAAEVARRGYKKVGLLATDGTIATGLYQDCFKSSGIEMITPETAEEQAEVMRVIYDGVKAGNAELPVYAFRNICQRLISRGAQTLILGCTELPPAFAMYDLRFPTVDPTLELALEAIRQSGCRLKPQKPSHPSADEADV